MVMHMDPDEVDPSDFENKEFCENGPCLAKPVERCTDCKDHPVYCKPCSTKHAIALDHIMEAYTPRFTLPP
jgi:hypothetical protein